MDSPLTHLYNQRLKSRLDVLHAAFAFPVAFGGKINYITGIQEAVEIMDEHLPGLQFLFVAYRLIALEIFRKCFLELKGDSPAHNPDTIHGIHQCLGICAQYIALRQFNHECPLIGLIILCSFDKIKRFIP